MTVIHNDPADFADDQFAGFLDLYSDRLTGVAGGVVAHRSTDSLVAVVVGGGSGHYPAFCGLVGPGFATGAVVGNIFTSPSATQVYSVARAADQGRGVILAFGNYAGDVINFGIAANRLRTEGIDTRIVIVTDDVASAADEPARRGIAGDFTVFKALGAAAAAGMDLDDVERVGRAANAATRSMGVAFSGCTLPGATAPLFTVPPGQMGVGLGIHGEPGIRDSPLLSARELAALLVEPLLSSAPETKTRRVAPLLNGLGATKYEELFLLWGEVAPLLRAAGLSLVEPEVGEMVTSLDMGGCSLTLMWLDDELEQMWSADAYAPAYRKVHHALAGLHAAEVGLARDETIAPPSSSAAGVALAPLIADALATLTKTVSANEAELGRIDAVAGDGDHGRGMVRGATAAMRSIESSDTREAGPAWMLIRAGRAWGAEAGGTSGVLWGAGLESAGRAIGDDRDAYTAEDAVFAARAFGEAIIELGHAGPGDKTIIDALLPFTTTLDSQVRSGRPLAEAWQAAASVATDAANSTAFLRPRRGRALPLADKSVGTADPGAVSFGLIVTAIGNSLASGSQNEHHRDRRSDHNG